MSRNLLSVLALLALLPVLITPAAVMRRTTWLPVSAT